VRKLEDLRFESAGLAKPDALYGIRRDGSLTPPHKTPGNKPVLLLLHGTWRPTEVGFEALLGSGEWASIHRHFGGRVFAHQRRTLSESPVDTALQVMALLGQWVESTAPLHLLSSSQGGLTSELLCLRDGDETRRAMKQTLPTKGQGKDYRDGIGDLLTLASADRIHRHLRVACPARGTTLLSKRTDRYLSAAFSALMLAGANPAVCVFLRTVAAALLRYSKDPRLVPGLAAMRPEDPLIAFLNHPAHAATADRLAVVAGDAKVGRSLRHSLHVMGLDLLFRTKHDLVIDTNSMSGGLPRKQKVLRLYESTPKTQHGAYYSNASTRLPMASWLRGNPVPDFLPVGHAEDPLGERGLVRIALGMEQGYRDPGLGEAGDDRDVVILLPGIMGSHLQRQVPGQPGQPGEPGQPGQPLWFSYEAALRAEILGLELRADDHVRATGALAPFYQDLGEYLQRRKLRMRVHAYDWRKDLLELGEGLAKTVAAELDQHPGRRVHLLCHSMGGLVVRGMIASQPTLWERLKERGGRLIMAGTPNEGAWSLLRMVLTGEHQVMSALNFLLRAHQRIHGGKHDNLGHFTRRFPGVLQMLPWENRFFVGESWSEWRGVEGVTDLPADDPNDPLPTAADLTLAWRRIGLLKEEGAVPAGTIYLAGHATWTATKIDRWTPDGDHPPAFQESRDAGDGTVPWKGGIPAGADVYYVRAGHDQILRHSPAFAGICDLLQQGRTSREQPQRRPPASHWWGVRGDPERAEIQIRGAVPHAERDDAYPSREHLQGAMLGLDPKGKQQVSSPLPIAVAHGSLHAARWPLVIGHHRGK